MNPKTITRYSSIVFLTALWGFLISPADAATIIWTNVNGGNWSTAANWNSNQVPGSADAAIITNGGTYTVTLSTSPTVNSLTLGGGSGQQTLATAGQTLTLASASVVGSNGVLALNGGGQLGGAGLLTVNGQFIWTNGQINGACALVIGTNGVLALA